MGSKEVKAKLEDVLGELRDEGRLDSTGRFTLDPDKAFEKLKHFQLAEPQNYVIWLVSAAVRGQASFFSIVEGVTSTCFEFDGEPLTYDFLSQVLQEDILQGFTRAADLGVTVSAILKTGATEVLLASPEAQLRLTEDSGSLDPVKLQNTGPNRLVVNYPPSGMFRRLQSEQPPFTEIIKERCHWAPLEFSYNGSKLVTGKLNWYDCTLYRTFGPHSDLSLGYDLLDERESHQLFQGVLGLRERLGEPSELELVVHGVTFRHQVKLGQFCVRGVLHCPQLSLDISRSNVVENAAYFLLEAELKKQAPDMADSLATRVRELTRWRRKYTLPVLRWVAERWDDEGRRQVRELKAELATFNRQDYLSTKGTAAKVRYELDHLCLNELSRDLTTKTKDEEGGSWAGGLIFLAFLAKPVLGLGLAAGAVCYHLLTGGEEEDSNLPPLTPERVLRGGLDRSKYDLLKGLFTTADFTQPTAVRADLTLEGRGWLELTTVCQGWLRMEVRVDRVQNGERLRLVAEPISESFEVKAPDLPMSDQWALVKGGRQGHCYVIEVEAAKLNPDLLLPVIEAFRKHFLNLEKKLSCPQCGMRMEKLSLDVVLDRCKHCHGLWLDKGECEALGLLKVPFPHGGAVRCPRCRTSLDNGHCNLCGGVWIKQTVPLQPDPDRYRTA